MKAEEQAKKIWWALMKAAEMGEEARVELTIIENGLKEYAQLKCKEEREKQCNWKRNDDGAYETQCGNVFEFLGGSTPEENAALYCQYCGKKIIPRE